MYGNIIKSHTRVNKNPYLHALTDTTVDLPFQLNAELQLRASSLKESGLQDKSLARAIYSYLYEKIEYGQDRHGKGYANSSEVWEAKQGICGEMTFLYVAFARFCGLRANYVSVTKDAYNKKTHHACAGIHLDQLLLSDIAYHEFEIAHRKFEVLTDNQVIDRYVQWRNA